MWVTTTCCQQRDGKAFAEDDERAKEVRHLASERDAILDSLLGGATACQMQELRRAVRAVDTHVAEQYTGMQCRGMALLAQLDLERRNATEAYAQAGKTLRGAEASQRELDNLQFQMRASKEEWNLLQVELASAKASEASLAQCLSGVVAKLKATKTSWNPWKEMNELRELVDSVPSADGTQAGESASVESLEVLYKEARQRVKTLEEDGAAVRRELARRGQDNTSSLSRLSQSISEISDKLGKAEASWSPWQEINDVKQQLSTMQATVGEATGTRRDEASNRLIGG